MRIKHKTKIAEVIKSRGFELADFEVQTNTTDFTIKAKFGKLFFTFFPNPADNNEYKHLYKRYTIAKQPFQSKFFASFDSTLNTFREWLDKDVKAFMEDQDLKDPFAEFTESKSTFFSEESSKDDDSKLTPEESKTFKAELKNIQQYIESKYNLQKEQIDEIKKSLDVLATASKSETKGELKKGLKKFFLDFIQKFTIQGLIEGAKALYKVLQDSPIDISEFTDQIKYIT